MQTSLRRQRRRRLSDRRRPRGNGSTAVKAAAVAIPLFLFTILVLLGVAGATASVAAYSFLSRDLADPQQALDDLGFTQQTTVFDRSGQVQLARLGDDRREVVTFADIPPALIDATTSIEDKTFWENSGFDPAGFIAAAIDTIQGRDRGGSTITQQLVRARLLPSSAFDGSIYERKAKEIIQSIRLTQAYPGEAGKQVIIEKYLNQNFYGNRSYGVAAAARSYWNKDLKDLTLAQMAILAGIPQSPTRFDLVKNAVEETYKDAKGQTQTHLVVPPTSEIVQRRNFILDLMKTRSELTGSPDGFDYLGKHYNAYTAADFEAAKAEPVILGSQATAQWRAPQFVWQVRNELGNILCGDATQCEKIDTGGYQVTTTLDYRMQRIVEKWAYVAAIAPNASNPNAILKNRQIPRSEWSWIKALRGHNIHNDAAGVIDYRTGEVLAYAGSASYTAKGNRKFQPQFDVLSDGWRQPGSSIKPLVYSIGIDDQTMTAATMFMDVVTNFAPSGSKAFYPTQADGAERGPVRLRSALQFSLNIPAIKAGIINGVDHEFNRFKDFGLTFPSGTGPVVVREHRHPRHPPDPDDLRVRRHRQRRRADAAPHDREGDRRPGQRRLAARDHQDDGRPDHRASDVLHHHGHPRGQHDPQREPVLGQVADHRRRDGHEGPPRRVQDRHDERQPRRPRLRLPRAALGQEAAGPRRRRLDGQLRQLAQRRQALARHLRAAVVGDPLGRVEGDADRGIRPHQAQGPDDRDGRRVHGHEAGVIDPQDRRRALHPRHRAQPARPTSASRWTSTRPRASSGARAAPDRWSRGRSSTSATSSPAIGRGSGPTSPGRPGRRAASACRAGPRARTRPTSMAAGSSRSAPRGAASSPRPRPASSRRRRRPPCISIDPFNPCPSAPPEPSPSPGAGLGFGNGNGGGNGRPVPRP